MNRTATQTCAGFARRLWRPFNRLIMLDFGVGPVPASVRCRPPCVVLSIRVAVDRLWMKDDGNPNNRLPFHDKSIYSDGYIEGRGVVRRYVVHLLHESRKSV
ncbi:hypothetical protein [Burkholderia sp. Ac-20344]|uniref:hypothetical protein n=1 Tax=Burkholderia sp. Ac-20344 TaxID=2703890 RepID=UPI00197B2D2C|nr:hypothetical protein [Burkholderia sp. Ac-20344]MBN3830555.1 hypothetical protein [Burkholderia sp. Ac-20344]